MRWSPDVGGNTVLRSYLFLILLLFIPLQSCYHMRVEAEPIQSRFIVLKGQQKDAVRKIRTILEDDWKCRIIETDGSGNVLITAPYHFSTDTGFGQPAGGRKYYTQLKIVVESSNNGSVVHLSHYNFEIRTSYAYNNYARGGEVGTMYKHYPYEEYPGMFDLTLINREMDRVSAGIAKIFMEYK